MSDQVSEGGAGDGGEAPAGFPGQTVSLDIEADADARALAFLAPKAAPEIEGEPTGEEGTQGDGGAEEHPEERAGTEGEGEPTPPGTAPQITAELAQVLALRADLEKQQADLTEKLARMEALDAREKELEPFARFAEKSKSENLFAALQELYPDRKPDDLVRAIAEGRGVERPEDKIASAVEKVRAEFRTEIEKFEAVQAQRAEAEFEHTFTTTATAALAEAPLVAAFGEEGLAAVRQVVNTERANGSRVTGDTVRKALESVEGQLVENFLTKALRSEAVRTKYAEQLAKILPGMSGKPAPVNAGHSLSTRAASQTTHRASTDNLTEEQRDELALRHLRR